MSDAIRTFVRRLRDRVELVIAESSISAKRGETRVTKHTRFSVYAELWIEKRVSAGLRSETDYRSIIDLYLVPTFGEMRMNDIRPKHVRHWMETLRGKTELAPRSIRNIYAVLRNLLAYAVSDEVIDANPCCLRRSELPPNDPKNADFHAMAIFERWEVAKICDLDGNNTPAVPLSWRTLYRSMFFTGARIGELLALTWGRVLLDAEPLGKIVIASSYSSKNARVTSPKTRIGRQVPIHPRLSGMLREWRDRFESITATKPDGDVLVFPWVDLDGTLYHRKNTVVLHRFHDDLDKLGLRKRRVHDARRTFITQICAVEGINKDIVRRITHARPGDVHSSYNEVSWESMCREMAKWKV